MDQLPPTSRRARKRLATRQTISDVATRLFIEHGFDRVTVDQIAEAADVSRMTVFNHFARKEDMFFDLDDEARKDLISALENRKPGTPPVEALRQFAHWAVEQRRPYVRFASPGSDRFMRAIETSEALRARARAIREEFTALLTAALAGAADRPVSDSAASLAASFMVATWVVASLAAQRNYREGHQLRKANKVFLAIVDQGAKGAKAAVKGTPYA